MVGVPKSMRCTFCKARKTKASPFASGSNGLGPMANELEDSAMRNGRPVEHALGPARSARAPGNLSNLSVSEAIYLDRVPEHVNGSHNELPDDAVVGTEKSRLSLASVGISKTDKRWQDEDVVTFNPRLAFVNGYSFKCYSPATLSKSPPWSPPDQLIAHLTACLDAAPGTGHDLRILGAFLPLIPRHLSSGQTALGHAVELLLGAWENSRRGLPSNMWLDLRTYNRALSSLQAALDDVNAERLTNTLTTLCILQKTEILYDFGRGSNQENHAAGLIAVINRGGPAQPMTEMALHVTFESIFHMDRQLQEDIRQGRESDFHTPEWMAALKETIDASKAGLVLKHLYHLWVEVTAWPGLARLVRLIRRNPSDTMTAAELHLRATSLAELLQHQDETILASLAESGAISKVENKTRPDLFSKCYKFEDFQTAKLFSTHAFFTIVTCRFLQEANRVLGHKDPLVEKQARRFSKRTWMAYPWLRSQTPLAVDFTACLVFSYESGNEEERKFCAACLREMDSSRHPPPIGEWVEATIMANAKAYSGRLPFIKTQDPTVEYNGETG
ncbi:hypothetical protein EKO27_g2995 [Xylaria grammica]|uniref:Uncharacterized protein n=1 Tax=Xylaria grammica TaxID=363999 RepID=A0A439DCH1_9PEZI|nr:hypothetical protein EKO27_g2995 [Xylaria grammica]